jgi:metallo-beta-lactamase class B
MCTRCAFVGGLVGLMAAPALAAGRAGDPRALEIAMPDMRRVSDTLWIGRLTTHVWIHTTTHVIPDVGFYPANGAIVVDGDQALLIDTGWSDADAEAILAEWRRMRMPPIANALATHFHSDRVGGIGALARHGIPTYGNPVTIGLALDCGFRAPRPLHEVEKHPHRLGSVEVFFPGEGHTIDNIVTWIPDDRVLFGGCLLKATTAPDLGNVADANLGAYPATIRRVAQAYAPHHVIPGHGTLAGDAVAHTAALAEAASMVR